MFERRLAMCPSPRRNMILADIAPIDQYHAAIVKLEWRDNTCAQFVPRNWRRFITRGASQWSRAQVASFCGFFGAKQLSRIDEHFFFMSICAPDRQSSEGLKIKRLKDDNGRTCTHAARHQNARASPEWATSVGAFASSRSSQPSSPNADTACSFYQSNA